MKRLTLILFVCFLSLSTPLLLSGQNLSYTQLSSGLATPGFDSGRSDFCLDDINMDGNIDILTIGDHGSPLLGTTMHGICVWFGDGQGNFENAMFGDFGYGGIAVGDVNGDGLKDAAYGMHHNYSSSDLGDQILEVALGDGSGSYWAAWDDGLATNGEDWGMFGTDLGDVDNDGDLDVVSISFGSGAGLHVYLNQGDGTWEQSFGFLNGNSDNLVEFGDFNHDGYIDFLASHEYGSAYFGDGMGSFTNNDDGLPALASYQSRAGISTGDVNNDGATDIAFVNNDGGIEIYLWDENFSLSWIAFSGDLPQSGSFDYTDLADMNSDGFLDLAAFENENLLLWLGDGQGNWSFETSISFDPGTDAKALRLGGDFDKNGFPDLLVLVEEGSWPSYQNYMYCFAEASLADSLWIMPLFPKGNENFYPGSVQFIEWASEVPAGDSSTVSIEVSAYGQQGPWWLVADNIPNNGKFQWTVPNLGSTDVFLKLTVCHFTDSASAVTPASFTIFGNPNAVKSDKKIPNLSIYPNPGTDFFIIQNHHLVQSIKLSDIMGNICFEAMHPSQKVELRQLAPGVYFYTMRCNNGSTCYGKWIKNKG